MKRLIAVLVLVLSVQPLWAVQPGEMLADPVLEARAREISKGLRCLVCRNENIDDSNAALAHDLRVLVRDRLMAGDTDAQVVDFIVERYGEYVLLRPTARGVNLLLWIAGPLMLVAGLGIGGVYVMGRRRRDDPAPEPLSPAELARLRDLTGG